MKMFKRFIGDQRAVGYSATLLKGITIIFTTLFMIAVLIDGFYIAISYNYIKTQMDMANRAVYSKVDLLKLSEKIVYIDEAAGEAQFMSYLRKNLKLDNNMESGLNIQISGPVQVMTFEIYNPDELPAVTPVGTSVNMVTVHSRLEARIRPIFIGMFTDVTIRPYIDTDLPDNLL